jgi:hypothetical protein
MVNRSFSLLSATLLATIATVSALATIAAKA